MKTILGIILGLLAVSGAPLFLVFSAAALLSFYFLGINLSLVIIEMYRLAANPLLIALVYFAFAGYLLAEGSAGRRLVRLSTALFGCLPGGLAIVCLVSCAFFTAITGASGVTIVALGGILLPALLEERYPENFSLGLVTSSGSLGLLFPPSLPIIIYGVVSGASIPKLFLAGVVPGVLSLTLLAVYCVYKGMRGQCRTVGVTFQGFIQAAREAVWELLLPVVVLGGIFSGFLALSEAAAMTLFYVLVISLAVRRDIKLRHLPGIVVKTVTMVGGLIVILGAALAFNSFLVDQEVPMKILRLIQAHVESRIVFLVMLNLFLLVVGCLLDVYSALVVIGPLIIPVAQAYRIDLLHLGVIFLANLQIGYSTPPIGMNLFIASLRFDRSILRLSRASLPFLAILLVALVVITFVPEVTLLLVR
jgi:tripartite ATP-independent transporter DctM subunit